MTDDEVRPNQPRHYKLAFDAQLSFSTSGTAAHRVATVVFRWPLAPAVIGFAVAAPVLQEMLRTDVWVGIAINVVSFIVGYYAVTKVVTVTIREL